jgi:RNA polymerase sigma-70 factor, ECF subfamily
MVTAEAALASSFLGAYRGERAAVGADDALEAALQELWARGREAWPEVTLPPALLAAYLGARIPADAAPLAWLAARRAPDLFLASACSTGLPEALRAFDKAYLAKVDAYLRALRPTPEIVAETTQELRTKLFVGVRGRPPKILQFTGQGALGGWVRVAAVRTALNLLEATRAGEPRRDEVDEVTHAIVPDGDPELALLRATYKDVFMVAFREAIAALSRRDRAVLRFTFVEHLTPARVGAMYGVHRTTATRWIDAAQGQVLAGTRARMMERQCLSPSECDHVLALVQSRIEFAVASLLKSAS